MNPARMYRETAVRGASPVGLIVVLYDEVIRSLRRAHRGFQQNDIEQRCLGLTHAIQVIGHLQSVLNYQQGADVAQNLSNFYNVARKTIIEANNTANAASIDSLATDFSNVAQAWQQADRELGHPVDEPASAKITAIPAARLNRAHPRLHR
jgi:flagellar protein FliS